MRAHAGMILFISTMLLAGVAVGVFYENKDAFSGSGETPSAPAAQARISGVSVYGIQDGAASYATIEITGGSQAHNLSQLSLSLQAPTGENVLTT